VGPAFGGAVALPADVQGVLGWVVREGATNMLRHSEARTCVFALEPGPGAAVLTLTNDGVAAGAEPVRFGSGLAGLAERLAGLGGRLTAERTGPDGFRLAARVPLP
jgi:two-component system sensor histidine kinase DesK